MWPSIKLWLGWVMNDLIPAARGRPGSQAVHLRYEAVGRTFYEMPIPWSADVVIVEVLLRLAPPMRQKNDYALRIPGCPPILPDLLRKDDKDPKRYRLTFRLPAPEASVRAELLWKMRLIADVPIPVLTAEAFLSQLQIANPTVAVKLGDCTVAATTFVAAQCRGLMAMAVIKSPTTLAPLAELGLHVTFRSDRTAIEYDIPVTLTSSQLSFKEAMFAVSPPKLPRKSGNYSATWYAGTKQLARIDFVAVTLSQFAKSLRVSGSRFAIADRTGLVRMMRHPPQTPGEAVRIGPCFVLNSYELGMAGWIDLRAVAQSTGSTQHPPLELTGLVLITDGPSLFAPGMLDEAMLRGITAFELRYRKQLLSILSLNPVPMAAFNAEGGFKPPPEFSWSPTADEELAQKLSKLMRGEE